MNTPHIQTPTIETSQDPARAAGQYISDILSSHIGQPTLLLLAGGSSIEVVDHINPEYLGDNVTVTVTDERFTDDMAENNFDILQTTQFYNELTQVDAFCINTSVMAGDTAESHAERFDKNIRDWMAEFPKGIIIGLYGMGKDGHIGGIIPGLYHGSEFQNKFNGEKFVTTVIDEKKETSFPERVSTTFSFMKKINFPLMFMKGEEKKSVLQKVLSSEVELEAMPVSIIKEMKGVVIFADFDLK